jgi:hypothetical protein
VQIDRRGRTTPLGRAARDVGCLWIVRHKGTVQLRPVP